jgi:hypothetical protein
MMNRNAHFFSLSFSALLLIFSGTLLAVTISVPGDYTTIQGGIDSAANGDTVLVAPGIYYENINFRGKNIVLTSHYIFDENPEFVKNTIINGGNPSHPDTVSVVLFISGEDSTAVLQGFKLTGGKGTKWPDKHIGGFYREGGGILIEAASPTITHNLIMNNEATDKTGVNSAGGGAIRCDDGNPRILNNVIMSNRGLYGAGIVLNFTGAIIKNNLIYANTGGQDYGGSGIWAYSNGSSSKIIENNTIVDNISTGSGSYGGKAGGMLVWSTSITACNNIIWGNIQSQGGQIAQIGGQVSITYSNVEDVWQGEGNINQEPAFADSNYYLSDNSPCIDAGNPDTKYDDPEDPSSPGFAGFPAKGELRNDMGAYGGAGCRVIDFLPVSIEEKRKILKPGQFYLEQNYPNPFNASTKISFELPRSSKVKLVVFDALGRCVRTLEEETRHTGKHSIIWRGDDDVGKPVTSGIYFLQLQVDRQIITRKALLLK